MRRRRLMGMYRVLLKSMELGAPDDLGLRPTTELPRRPGTWAIQLETEQEPCLLATYLIGPFSTIDTAPPMALIRPRSPGADSTCFACGLTARCLADSCDLCRQRSGPPHGCPGPPFSRDWNFGHEQFRQAPGRF